MEIGLFGPDGQEVKKDSLSKGEQQLYASSILKALVDESGLEFPVFIDSPLQKFDKSHSGKDNYGVLSLHIKTSDSISASSQRID